MSESALGCFDIFGSPRASPFSANCVLLSLLLLLLLLLSLLLLAPQGALYLTKPNDPFHPSVRKSIYDCVFGLYCSYTCAVAYFTINYSSVAHYSSLHHHPLLSIHQGAPCFCTRISFQLLNFPSPLFLLLSGLLGGGGGSVVKEKRDPKVHGDGGRGVQYRKDN